MPIGSAVGSFATGFMKGYDWGQEKRAELAKKGIARLEAEGPKDVKMAIDPERAAPQISQLEDQARDLYEGDPEVQALEDAVYEDTGRTTLVKKDWDSFTKQLALYAGAIPDIEVGRNINERVQNLQAKGFSENAMKAAAQLEAGNAQAAGQLMQKAWGYAPDGTAARYLTQQVDGNPVVTMYRINEETGQPEGNPVPLDAEAIRGLAAAAESPEKFYEMLKSDRDYRLAAREVGAKETTAEAAKLKAEADMVYSEAAASGTLGRGGTDQSWNSASAARVPDKASKWMTNRLTQLENAPQTPQAERMYDLHSTYGPQISAYTEQLMGFGQTLNAGQMGSIAESIVDAGATLVVDPRTNQPYVKYPDGKKDWIPDFLRVYVPSWEMQ